MDAVPGVRSRSQANANRRQRTLLPADAAPGPVNAGCAFAPRCPWRQAGCSQTAPALRPMASGADRHLAACHHAETVMASSALVTESSHP